MRSWLLAVYAGCSILCGGCDVNGPSTGRGSSPIARSTPANQATKDRSLVGVIVAAESVEITPLIAGTLREVIPREGDRVTAGDIVARMETASARELAASARAALAAADAATDQANVEVQHAKRKVEEERRAVASGLSAAQTLQDAESGLQLAEAVLKRSQANRRAEAARAQAVQLALEQTELRTPITGIVERRYVDGGNRVAAGSPILRIANQHDALVRFAAPPDTANDLPLGTELLVRVETLSAPVSAVVTQVAPTIDSASRMIFVEAKIISESEVSLRSGLAAWVNKPKLSADN